MAGVESAPQVHHNALNLSMNEGLKAPRFQALVSTGSLHSSLRSGKKDELASRLLEIFAGGLRVQALGGLPRIGACVSHTIIVQQPHRPAQL